MSHPSDTPHSSHVESRSRKALRSYIIQAATLLERWNEKEETNHD